MAMNGTAPNGEEAESFATVITPSVTASEIIAPMRQLSFFSHFPNIRSHIGRNAHAAHPIIFHTAFSASADNAVLQQHQKDHRTTERYQ